jgi:hypothetical protein
VVGDRGPAAGVQLGENEAVLVADGGQEGDQAGHRLFVGCGAGDLGTDVAVHAGEFEARRGQHPAHRFGRRAGGDRQTELLVVGARGDRPVGMCVHAGGDPEQDALPPGPQRD